MGGFTCLQKHMKSGAQDLLDRSEVQAVVKLVTWVLGTRLRFSMKAVHSLNTPSYLSSHVLSLDMAAPHRLQVPCGTDLSCPAA